MILCTNPKLSAIWERVLPKVGFPEEREGVDLSQLSHQESVFYLVFWLDCECQNGGMSQFITNSSGDLYHETIAALEEIGADRTAALMREIEAIFGEPLKSDRWERNKQFEELTDEQVEFLEDGVVDHARTKFGDWVYEEDERLLLAYVDRHNVA